MAVTIREATAGDAPGLEILRSQAIEAACSDVYDRSAYADLVVPDGSLGERIESGAVTVLLAETDITPVSFGELDDPGTIAGLYTSPDYQREGFATAVLERVLDRAREHGLGAVSAAVPTVATPFFEANGFEPGGETTWQGLPAVRMTRSIDG